MTTATSAKKSSSSDYKHGLDSCLRIIDLAQPGLRFTVFKQQAKQAAEYVRKGGLEKDRVLNALNDSAFRHGLIKEHGQEAVHAALTDAFADAPSQNGHHGGEQRTNRDQKERFRIVRFADLKTSTSPNALIKGLVPRVGLIVVWGPPKSGKSFWITDAMLHVALGWDYRGRKVIPGPVVYGAFEGAEGFGKRAEAFRKQYGHVGNLDPPFFLFTARIDFVADHTALVAAISRQIGTQKPVAVVLDTLNRSLNGSESNDLDMAKYIRAADAVREAFDCAVIIVHHCGIDGTRPRGHTSLTGAVDAQLAVKRNGAGNIEVKVEWMKDGLEGDTIWSRLEPVNVGTDESGEAITSCVVVPVEINKSDDETGTHLTANQKTMFAILYDAGERGLSTETWNERTRDAGIGTKRKADLHDIRSALVRKKLVRATADGWTVNHR